MKTAELLSTLNAHRATIGKPALKSWKESRAKLEAAVAAIPRRDGITIADLCRQLSMNPKVARAKMRRHQRKQYVIPADQIDEVTAFLRS